MGQNVRVKVYLKNGQIIETMTREYLYSFAEYLNDSHKMGLFARIHITGNPNVTIRARHIVGMEYED